MMTSEACIGQSNPPHGPLSEEEDDQMKSDLEVATVLSKGIRNGGTSPILSPPKCFSTTTPAKHNYSPFRPSTVMTNISRGNTRTVTPILPQILTIHQMAAQGEMILMNEELQETDVNIRDEYSLTPILWAASSNQLQTVERLLELGGDPSICGPGGENALLLASTQGHERIVRCLIQAGMDINHQCKKDNTALLYAAYENHVECVRTLLEWGADLTLANQAGHTPLDIAITHGHKDVQHAIERHLLKLLDPS